MSKKTDQIVNYLKTIKNRDSNPKVEQAIKDELQRVKLECVNGRDQAQAKSIWCLEQILEAQREYLTAYSQLKSCSFYPAWCTLERCELAIDFLEPHYAITDDPYFLQFIRDHVSKYQSLFPYRLFLSTELVEHGIKCTICGKRISIRSPCGHEPGEIYDGELCLRSPEDIECLGISLVESPVHKYAVAFPANPDSDDLADPYNYELLEYLMPKLNSAFDAWDVKKSRRVSVHAGFAHLGRNDKCPCGSGKKYKKCCLGRKGVEMDHYEFIL